MRLVYQLVNYWGICTWQLFVLLPLLGGLIYAAITSNFNTDSNACVDPELL